MRYGTKAKKTETSTKGKKAKVVCINSKNKSPSKKRGITHKDVVIMFLAEGLSLIEKNFQSGKVTITALRRAALDLKESYPERSDLLTAFVDNLPPAGRGRTAPKAGDERDYKAQKIGTNEPFLRLPLSVLGVKKGEAVTVLFQEGVLKVTKKAG